MEALSPRLSIGTTYIGTDNTQTIHTHTHTHTPSHIPEDIVMTDNQSDQL